VVALFGPAFAGKTTLLQRIQERVAQESKGPLVTALPRAEVSVRIFGTDVSQGVPKFGEAVLHAAKLAMGAHRAGTVGRLSRGRAT
jgi:hypothetical protein